MKISLQQLVEKSNFKKYHFLIDAKEIEEGTISTYRIKFKKSVYGDFSIRYENPDENNVGWRYYDIGKITNIINPKVEIIAHYIEQTKAFNFEKLEIDFENQAAYIHLTRRQL